MPPSALRLLQLIERQEGHHALAALLVENDGVALRHHLFHGLQVDALPRHVGRLLVFLIDLGETGGLAIGFGDRLLLLTLSGLIDQRTTKSTSTIFSSPVSIRLSSGTSRGAPE